MTIVIENLIKAREAAGNPSFKTIAQKAHCSPLTVSHIFNGKNPFPDLCTLDAIATALNTTLEKILSGTDASVGDVSKLEEKIFLLTEENTKLRNKLEALEMALSHKNEVIALKDEIINIYRSHSVTSI